ncbi:hypothetical protein JQN72_03905 [Phycicoccus sp. CSK15P-2]|uniref:biotin synthase auxiliary protein BsaP n=1 Tax=Phycicoccus sp. CSK15P-2 TaxID=2807627 RepID=UPI001950D045|nr:hypothetical protein [Phycicoccus sp. CSK15P-2]MBM6403386.1 hypothetical protein [Phycicoccus sp. CSK15P-2]
MFADVDPDGPVARGDGPGVWCGQCGTELAGGDHARCAARAALEPPRYCMQCRRRMQVQVTPGAWTATCSRHGSVERSTWS